MTPKTTPRSLALEVLADLERRRRFADASLDAALRRCPHMGRADRGLATELVYGVLRWRNRLDAHLATASKRPLTKIHPRLLTILRIAAYQILFLDRVPARAAVHEAVEQTRQTGLAHAAGFANAILRNIASNPELPPSGDPVERLSLLFGCPGWLVERWMEQWGPGGAENLCEASSRTPPLWLRLRSGAGSAADLAATGIDAVAGDRAPEAVRIKGAGDPRNLPPVAGGLAVVQDQGSQLVSRMVDPADGARVLDLCAGPGMKTTHLADLAGARGRVTAVELHPHRARAVAELARRLALDNVDVVAADARTVCLGDGFDAVLVDAPCSGLGVLARTPEAKWRRGPDQRVDLPILQGELLWAGARAVRPGGVLVYATCTTEAAENEGVVNTFLEAHGDFAVEPPPPRAARWDGLVDAGGFLRTYPGGVSDLGPGQVDGFFAARLRRKPSP